VNEAEPINLNKLVSRTRLWLKKLPFVPTGIKYLLTTSKESRISIGSRLEDNARDYPDHPAILYKDERYTYSQFNETVNRYAHCLADLGIGKGDTVAILMENRPAILFCVAAAAKLGAVAGLLNTSQRGDTLIHSIKVIKPKVFVCGSELLHALLDVQDRVELDSDSIYFVPDDEKDGPATSFRNLADLAHTYGTANPAATAAVKAGDACYYIFTSGTTDLPKASVMTHLRWLKASAAFGSLALHMTPEDVIYISLPFYHNNALTVAWSSAISGGSAVAIRRKFSASNFWADTRKYNATAFCYIGELCRYLINQPEQPNDRDNPVIKIVGNGLRPDIWTTFKERFGIEEVYEFYAASESNLAFTNFLNFDSTIGFTLPGRYCLVEYDVDEDELKRDEDGFLIPVKKGGTGLLLIQVSDRFPYDGYTDKKASEKKLIRNAFKKGDTWFNSGDLVKDVGLFHSQFVDRLGDTFRWKGENVSTYEVELVINRSPNVLESIVYGVTIPGADGRAGMAALILDPDKGLPDLDAFYRLLKTSLPGYSIPLFLRVLSDVETTGTFKYKKGNLKKEGWDPGVVSDELYFLDPVKERYIKLDAYNAGQVVQKVTGYSKAVTEDHRSIAYQTPAQSSLLFKFIENKLPLLDFVKLFKDLVVPPEIEQVINRNPKQVNEFGYDAWGFNPDVFKIITTFYKFFFDEYFKVEVTGLENVPPDGRVFIIANHSGQLPIDGGLLAVALSTNPHHPRIPRIMVERFLTDVPFAGNILNRYGAIIGDPDNCIKILQKEEAVIVFPEGVRGSGKLFRDRYQLQRFGNGFMHIAMDHRTPIVPVGIVGCEETMPSLADIKPLARLLNIPYFPLTVPFPLPSKVYIHFGKPMHFNPEQDSEDAVTARVDEVKESINDLIRLGLQQRKKYYKNHGSFLEF
jgi:citronellyl-CoA synthetase